MESHGVTVSNGQKEFHIHGHHSVYEQDVFLMNFVVYLLD